MRIALCQRTTYIGNKEKNIKETKEMINQAMNSCNDVDLIMFPENNFGEVERGKTLAEYAEPLNGEYVTKMQEMAKEYKVNLLPGSFSEKADNGLCYNTLPFLDRTGKVLGSYQKVHLFDSLGGKESEIVKPGEGIKLIDTEFGKVGLMICYDMRFPEMARSLALQGADLICSVACWPVGKVLPPRAEHWDTLTKATALYNLTYFAACNVYGEVRGSFPFGCSRVVDPWGTVTASCSAGKQIVYADIDFAYQKWVREEIGTFENRRQDVYQL